MEKSAVETIRRILKRHSVEKAALFGSFARGDMKKGSDIDLLIAPPKGFTLFDMAQMKEELESSLHRQFDLLTFNSLHGFIRPSAEKDMRMIV
jgi:predicted nucleotidyltransferase